MSFGAMPVNISFKFNFGIWISVHFGPSEDNFQWPFSFMFVNLLLFLLCSVWFELCFYRSYFSRAICTFSCGYNSNAQFSVALLKVAVHKFALFTSLQTTAKLLTVFDFFHCWLDYETDVDAEWEKWKSRNS